MSPDNPSALAERGIPQEVEGTLDPSPTTIQYVRVDHRGLDVLVPQQLLSGTRFLAFRRLTVYTRLSPTEPFSVHCPSPGWSERLSSAFRES